VNNKMSLSQQAPRRKQKLDDILKRLSEVKTLYGYSDIFLPIYEYYEVLSETSLNFDDDNIVRFIDRKTGKSLVLRPDFTPQVCRYAANYLSDHPMPMRLSYSGRVFRNVNSDKGIKAENYQSGCELFGSDEFEGDSELITIADKGLKKLGLDGYRIVISDSLFMNELLSMFENPDKIEEMIDQKNVTELKKAAENFDDVQKALLEKIPYAFGGTEVLDELKELCGENSIMSSRIEYAQSLFKRLIDSGIDKDALVYDATCVNGLDYYTGVTFDIVHSGTGFTIGSGGRYDSLGEKFGLDCSACGMAFYIEELMRLDIDTKPEIEFDYLVIGDDTNEKCEELREAGHSVYSVPSFADKENFEKLYSFKNIITTEVGK